MEPRSTLYTTRATTLPVEVREITRQSKGVSPDRPNWARFVRSKKQRHHWRRQGGLSVLRSSEWPLFFLYCSWL